jgi:metal-responsive CopG/Arc/MetJ family transcriptional regulator
MSETEKNKGGRPRVDATPITVRIPPDLLSAIDAMIAFDPGNPTRPEMIRRLVAEHPRVKSILVQQSTEKGRDHARS